MSETEETYTITFEGEKYRYLNYKTALLILGTFVGSEAQLTWVKQDLKRVNYVTFIADPSKFYTPGPRKIEAWLECSICGMNAIEHECEDCNITLCHQCFIKTKCAALEEEVRQDTEEIAAL